MEHQAREPLSSKPEATVGRSVGERRFTKRRQRKGETVAAPDRALFGRSLCGLCGNLLTLVEGVESCERCGAIVMLPTDAPSP